MNHLFLIDLTSGLAAGAAVIVAGAGGIAYLAYKMLRRTLKWGVRIAIVAVILSAAAAASIAMLYFSSGEQPGPKPTRRAPAR
jgi:DUF917 family protein